MVAYDYLLVELNFGAAFLCNLNHFIHALARFFLCMVSPRRCASLAIIVPSFHSQNKTQNARWLLIKKPDLSDRTKTIPNVETGFIAFYNDFFIRHNEFEGQRLKIRCLCSNRPIRNPKKQFIIILLDFDLWITVS